MELLALFALIPLAWFGYRLFRRRRRRAISARSLPDEWREILVRNVPLYARLPDALKQELHGHVQLFLHDKRFYGFDGLEVDDEMRLTVAGNACGACQKFCVRGGGQTVGLVKRSPYMTANWVMASRHLRTDRTWLASTLRSASHRSLVAASSLGKWPRVLMILRSCMCKLSIALVV